METMAALDDPIGDPLTVPNLLLGRAAAQDTDVILNGEGSDPCFGGPKNLPMLLHELYTPDESREVAYLPLLSEVLRRPAPLAYVGGPGRFTQSRTTGNRADTVPDESKGAAFPQPPHAY